jgi:hypothetical protein
MQTLHDNPSSEPFGNVRHDSEDFGSLPKISARKENHILTVHAVARMFEDAGVARTERSITNWCQPDRNGLSRLDGYFDTNERRYFITPQSVERAIEEEKSKIKSWATPHASEPFGSTPHPSEVFRTISHNAEAQAPEQPAKQQNENASPDLVKEVETLRRENMDLQITNRAKDHFIDQLREERKDLMGQALESSRRVGELETKLLQLAAPKPTPSVDEFTDQ